MKSLLVSLLCLGTALASSHNLARYKRIANGLNAPNGEYPFIASYQHVRNGHFCACVILNNVWLLTAAHCVIFAKQYPLKDLQVVAGVTNLYSSSDTKQIRKVVRHYNHTRFRGGIDPYDIGLIRVEYPFNRSTTLNSIRLPRPGQEFYGVVEIIGWGYRRSTYPAITADLQMAQTSIINTYSCNAIVNRYGARVDSTQICVVGYRLKNETTCEGDSGGPLIAYLQDVPYCIGIMSWDLSPCGRLGIPSVATKVSRFIRWISCRIFYDRINPKAVC
ncbi:lectizyme-like [Photinus pyralis]|uniref:Peptidase S1 domain-containing protein n=1 Tax=Photinus pyralis TaxID=7054 RepID=A0A1Y1MXX6_PHOPY|nr:lectizyme-like [Photinus pyralis]